MFILRAHQLRKVRERVDGRERAAESPEING